MNVFKRATISIKRMPIKSLILFLLIFLLGSLLTGAMVVRRSFQITEYNLRRNMLPVVLIEENNDEIARASLDDERWFERGNLTPDIVYEIGAFPYVDYFDYRMVERPNSSDVMPWYPHGRKEELMTLPNKLIFHDPDVGYNFIVGGVSHSDFIDKRLDLLEITNGSTFTEAQLRDGEHVAVVSTLWAAHNNLEIGGTFELTIVAHDFLDPYQLQIAEYKSYEFEIIGLFDIDLSETLLNLPVAEWGPGELAEFWQLNRIYLPNVVVRNLFHSRIIMQTEAADAELENFTYWEALRPIIFVLHDAHDFEAFNTAVQPMLPGFFEPYAYSNRYEAIAEPMSLVLDIADSILISTIFASIIIISLVTTLFLYDRRQEIGIYLALGEKRFAVIGQLLAEINVIAVVAMLFSVFIGNAVASQISQTMLENELAHIVVDNRSIHDFADEDTFEMFGFGAPLSAEDMIELFDFSLNVQTIIIFTGIGMVVTSISVIIPLIYVLKLEPKKILL